MSAADWLAERARIEQAASEGPWEHEGVGEIIQHFSLPEPATIVSTDVACMGYCYGGSAAGVERDEDAAFIADARTAMPKMRAALEAVLALHEPVAVYAQADECECGNEDHTIIESEQGDDLCWDTPTGEQRCGECLDEDGGYIDYPCSTVRAITEALTPAQRAAHDRRAARRAALAEDICWLRDTGEHPERAAQRLGLTPDALAKNIQRLGIEWPAAHTAQRRSHA